MALTVKRTIPLHLTLADIEHLLALIDADDTDSRQQQFPYYTGSRNAELKRRLDGCKTMLLVQAEVREDAYD